MTLLFESSISIPTLPLPEMTLRAAAVVPPIVLVIELFRRRMPALPLGLVEVPCSIKPDEVALNLIVVRIIDNERHTGRCRI